MGGGGGEDRQTRESSPAHCVSARWKADPTASPPPATPQQGRSSLGGGGLPGIFPFMEILTWPGAANEAERVIISLLVGLLRLHYSNSKYH